MGKPKGFVIAFDTLCDGWQCVRDDKGKPVIYATEKEAEAEIADFNSECDPDDIEDFVCPVEEYLDGRKTIFVGNGVVITGEKII